MRKGLATMIGTMFLVLALAGVTCAAQPPCEGTLNINSATAAQFAMLPGIDQDVAKNIIAYRDSNGAFSSPEELIRVKGMTYHEIDIIRPYLRLDGATDLRRLQKIGEYEDLVRGLRLM